MKVKENDVKIALIINREIFLWVDYIKCFLTIKGLLYHILMGVFNSQQDLLHNK